MIKNIGHESELKQIITDAFIKLKKKFYQIYKIEEREADTYPPVLALRDVIESLPPFIQVIEVIGPETHQNLKNGKGFILKFDYDHLNSDQLEYCGAIDYKKPEELVSHMVEKFHMKESDVKNYAYDICKHFQITGMWEPGESWYLHFIQDDIIKNPEALDDSLRHLFLIMGDSPIISDKFKRKFHDDYIKIYNLTVDRIIPYNEFLKPDHHIFNLDFEDLQRNVANIQLIPLVPDEVKSVFKRAKDLFIFGYFRYEFFTISQHYAFLALESAVKHRYIKSLGKEVILTDKKNKDLTHILTSPTYHSIESFGMKKGWNKSTLLANNKPFPYSMRKLIDWLEENHLIRKWEKQSYGAGLQLRHYLSHPERPSVFMPDSKMLKRIAEQINYLFHSKG